MLKLVEMTEKGISKYLDLYKLITKNIDNIDIDNLYTIIHHNIFNVNLLEHNNSELYFKLDNIINSNYEILSKYEFYNKEIYKNILPKKYIDLYYKHIVYEPLKELNISLLTRMILILKIIDIVLVYQRIFKLENGSTILKYGKKNGYPYMIIYNNNYGCLYGYIGLENLDIINHSDINIRYNIYRGYKFFNSYNIFNKYNNSDKELNWIGFDTLSYKGKINILMSIRYDSEEQYTTFRKYLDKKKSRGNKVWNSCNVENKIFYIINKLKG